MRLKLHSLFSLWLVCGVTSLVMRSTAQATTFVLMDEHELAAVSTAVVTGWVTGVESHGDASTAGVNTYVSIEPTAVIAGSLPEGEIVLRERGGQLQERSEKIFGAPEYAVGEQVVAFLSEDTDGSLHTTAMAMGKYTIQASGNGPATVTRALGDEVMVLDRATGRLHEHLAPEVLELGPFAEHVRLAARHSRRPGNRLRPVRLTPPELGVSVPHTYESPFTYLGNPSRWFEPDFGQPVLYQIDATGDARNGPVASRSAVDNAFAAWTNVPNSALVLGDGGLMNAPLPFTGCEGGSRIVFNDPFNEITDPSGCGGILAIGGYCSSPESRSVNGTTFQRITVGKVVFNNGWEQCDIWTACNLAEVATHEIGHTIGLGHSNDNTATMAAVAHFDGRCAALGSDDIAAAQFIYPEGSVPTPTATAAPQPTATSTPAPPTALPTPTSPSGFTNDACVNATAIDTTPYSNTEVTTSATIEATDPAPGCGNGSRDKSAWYRFTAPSNGTLTASTFGSSYDTILASYVGSCSAFSPVPGGCNDDSSGRQSRVSFQATAGTTYYFMATAYSNNGGSLMFQLTFQGTGNAATPTATFTPRPPTPIVDLGGPSPTPSFTPVAPTPTATSAPPPPIPNGLTNDSAATPFDIDTTPFTQSVSTTAATLDSTDPAPVCGNHSRAKSVWYRFTAPSNGTVTANTFGSNYDTILGAFVESGNTFASVACNDDTSGMQSRVSFQASGGTAYYFMVAAYSNTGGSLVFQLTFQGTGDPAAPTPTFTPRPATPTSTNGPPPTPTFTARPQVPTFTPTPGSGVVDPPPPTATSPGGCPNDSCGNAMDITTTPFSYSMATTTATLDATDPAPWCGNHSRAKSVWFRFTAPSDGPLTADTFGSNYDTILATFAKVGDALNAVSGACNDDTAGVQSRITLQASAGVTYYLLVTAYSNNGGNLNFHLSFQGTGGAPLPTATPSAVEQPTFAPTPTVTPAMQEPPPPSNTGLANETCDGATEIASTPYSEITATSLAAAEAAGPAPSCGNRSRGKSVWYRFTAPASGTLTANTYGSNYDTILAAYTGSCSGLSQVACNDDSGSVQSRVSFAVSAGVTYYFQVTAYRNDGGTLSFQVTN
jgi:hypothetical protein